MSPEPRRSGPGTAWAVAFATVAVTAILALSALYVFNSLRRLPGEAVEGGRRVLADLATVAAAFRQGTLETSFASYATTVTGSNFLQFATLRQTEVFTRRDQTSILWGQLPLPEVVVSATAPVEYTAYVDLDAEWLFRLEGGQLLVRAPEIRFNKPAIDASTIRYQVEAGSLLRDEAAVLEALQRGLTAMAAMRARRQVPLVRELGRRKLVEFVENWLLRSFTDGETIRVELVFADEESPFGPPLREPPREPLGGRPGESPPATPPG